MMIWSNIAGKSEVKVMVWTAPPGMLNLIVSNPESPAGASPDGELLLAAVRASRSVTLPSTAMVSPVPVTVIVFAETDDSLNAMSAKVKTVNVNNVLIWWPLDVAVIFCSFISLFLSFKTGLVFAGI